MSQKHLFKFQQENDYKTAKRNHLITPNISNVVETGNTYINTVFVSKEQAEAGDIIVYHEEEDGTKTVKYMKPEAFNKNDNYWVPEAIVVVPYSHTNDGTVRAMSVKNASTDSPGVGVTTPLIYVDWGKDDIEGLKQYDGVISFSSVEGQTSEDTYGLNNGLDGSIICPSDLEVSPSVLNPFDMETHYPSNHQGIIPSPYNNNGTPNDAYHSKGDFDGMTKNVLQDMDGAENTLAILKKLDQNYLAQTLYADVLDNQSTKTITVDGQEVTLDLFPAASVCARYSSVLKPCIFDQNKTLEENILTMPWYLPSAGELGYYFTRGLRIKYAWDKVNVGVYFPLTENINCSSVIKREDENCNIIVSRTNMLIVQIVDQSPAGVTPFCKF